ncbi:unnamed protein product [Lymnaea stagnalis]|uniref:Ig-like domain-containing protein n=1 Tax=Lymnaea stagnalis TaxID=6523 RepID=A0AAV2ICT4_LYMST
MNQTSGKFNVPTMLVTAAIVAMSLGTALCAESCLAVSQRKSVNLTCSGQAADTFRHIYWKSGDADTLIANCYYSHDECYINDTQRYWARRKDPSDSSFESSLIIKEVEKEMVITCFLWLAGREDEILINTTRVLVDGVCDKDKEAMQSTRTSYLPNTLSTNLLENQTSNFPTTSSYSTDSTMTTPTSTTPTSTTTTSTTIPKLNGAHLMTKTEFYDKRDNDKSEDKLNFLSLILLGIIGTIVCAVMIILVRRKLVKRRKRPNAIPLFTDHYDIPECEGHFYNTLNFSDDVVNNSVSPILALPLPPRPIRPCRDELNESSPQPPAYSEIYEIRTLFNDAQVNASSAHTLSRDDHRQRIENDQLRDATTQQPHRSTPTMKIPQTFRCNHNSTEPNSPPPDYDTSMRLKSPNWHSTTFNPDTDYIEAMPPPPNYIT